MTASAHVLSGYEMHFADTPYLQRSPNHSMSITVTSTFELDYETLH